MSPAAIAPGTRAKVSQIDGVRPSSATAPSIWYDAVAAPHKKPVGKVTVACRAGWGCPWRVVIP